MTNSCHPVAVRRPQVTAERVQETPVATPAADVNEHDDRYEIVLAVPGVARDDLEVTVERGELTIRGEHRWAAPEGHRVVRQEFGPVRYLRRFRLPRGVDAEAVAASLANGVVTVTVPKAAEAQARRIDVA